MKIKSIITKISFRSDGRLSKKSSKPRSRSIAESREVRRK